MYSPIADLRHSDRAIFFSSWMKPSEDEQGHGEVIDVGSSLTWSSSNGKASKTSTGWVQQGVRPEDGERGTAFMALGNWLCP